MKYFILDMPAESKETGNVYPQVAFDKVKEAFKFRYNTYPNEKPVLSATLEKGAKLTDILSQASIAGHGLLINEKAKEILARFNIMNHKFYNCPVKDHSENIHQYFWLELVQPELINLIEFENSKFYTTEAGFREDYINIFSHDDYLSKKEKLPNHTWSIEAESIRLNVNPELHLFVFPHLFYEVVISKKLKRQLYKYRITGIDIEKAPVI